MHGGYGYTRDFDVEQLWRDNRLNPIHEGTTGVQAIDLLRRKILLSDGAALALLQARIDDTAHAADGALAVHAAALTAFWRQVGTVIDGLREVDPARAFDDATVFLRAFGHGVVAWLWLDQAIHAAAMPATPLRIGVVEACRFFFETELPQASAWLGVRRRASRLHARRRRRAVRMTDILSTLAAEIGVVRHSGWRLIDQATIDRFADVTDDHQFIHVDPARAAATPFGGTIAHGFLTVSLMPAMIAETPRPVPSGVRVSINTGFDRLRFVAPVRAGSRIRLASTLAAVTPKAADRVEQAFDVTVEIEGATRPALAARWLCQLLI